MSWKAWLIVAVLLVVLGIVLGGVYAGLIASAIGGAAVQRARRREREHIKQQEVKKQKITKIEQINRDLKMETKVLQHKTNADLKRDVLKDAGDILGE